MGRNWRLPLTVEAVVPGIDIKPEIAGRPLSRDRQPARQVLTKFTDGTGNEGIGGYLANRREGWQAPPGGFDIGIHGRVLVPAKSVGSRVTIETYDPVCVGLQDKR
jgi:hypothetical protein